MGTKMWLLWDGIACFMQILVVYMYNFHFVAPPFFSLLCCNDFCLLPWFAPRRLLPNPIIFPASFHAPWPHCLFPCAMRWYEYINGTWRNGSEGWRGMRRNRHVHPKSFLSVTRRDPSRLRV